MGLRLGQEERAGRSLTSHGSRDATEQLPWDPAWVDPAEARESQGLCCLASCRRVGMVPYPKAGFPQRPRARCSNPWGRTHA